MMVALAQPRRADPLAYLAITRKIGGLLMIFGFAVFVYPIDGISDAIRNNEQLESDLDVCRVFGNIFLMLIGLLSVVTGYLQTAHDWGSMFLARYATIVTQAGWVVFLVEVTDVAVNTSERLSLIPLGYYPSDGDFKIIGVFSILGLIAYGTAMMGSLSFLQSILFSIHTGASEEREYHLEVRLYSFALFFAGMTQFIIGGYLMTTPAYEAGFESYGPIIAPLLVVYNPALNLAVGTGQMCNGVWGIIRSVGAGLGGGFFASTFAGWVVQVIAIFQAQRASVGTSVCSLIAASTVLHLMPLLADSMMYHSEASVVANIKMINTIDTPDA